MVFSACVCTKKDMTMAKIEKQIADQVKSMIVRVLIERGLDREKILPVMKKVVPNIDKLKELIAELEIPIFIEKKESETIVTHGGYIAKFV